MNLRRFCGLKNVGVPPPKCSSRITGRLPKMFLYSSHSFNNDEMYFISTSWFFVMRVLHAQYVQRVSQNGRWTYKLMPLLSFVSSNTFFTDSVHLSAVNFSVSQYGIVG